jgi:hypothetical protein
MNEQDNGIDKSRSGTEREVQSKYSNKYYISSFPEFYRAAFGSTTGVAVNGNVIDPNRAFFPNDVSVVRTAVGVFTLTHNLNKLEVYPFFVFSGTGSQMKVAAQTVDTITLNLFSQTGLATDAVFSYYLLAIP